MENLLLQAVLSVIAGVCSLVVGVIGPTIEGEPRASYKLITVLGAVLTSMGLVMLLVLTYSSVVS